MAIIISVLFFMIQVLIIILLSAQKPRQRVIERVSASEELIKSSSVSGIKKKKKPKVRVKRIEKMLTQADLQMTSIDAIFIYSILQVVALFSGYIFARSIFLSLVLMVVVHFGCLFVLKIRSKRRLKKFEKQLGDSIQIISNGMKAGYSFFQALNRLVEETTDPISGAFRQVIKEMSLGKSTEDVLQQLVTNFPIEDLELMITAILIQKEIGGNLADILDNILETIRERQRIFNEVRTLTAQGKLSGAIVMALPLFISGIIFIMTPEYMLLLINTFAGRIMIALALFNQMIGALIIRNIIKIEY
ncbi:MULTISPECIES: type II secretion system F family protein [unclassified Fusibacter]|uniref:type II secretion system F family protein n=1 Tax=unclassified Fusibacter TaxID=2624464 RepID=UPI0013E92EF8|nr:MULTISPECIES: type II secretion system F family protein [unclassified Fusibacter]MCK8059959.1 type II secretion system F family protein [Fusibacter sp. A2]NPE22101.1 secretion system protein [Fusibacter sp. A1]